MKNESLSEKTCKSALAGLLIMDEDPALEMPLAPPAPPAPCTTVIGADAVFEGDLRAEGHVQILGRVYGGVTAGGNVILSGGVEGDVSGDNISLEGCAVRGGVTARGELKLAAGTVVEGDLSARRAAVNGKVRGSVSVAETVVLQDDALVLGDVSGAHISMCDGAALVGAVHILGREEDKALAADFSRALGERL